MEIAFVSKVIIFIRTIALILQILSILYVLLNFTEKIAKTNSVTNINTLST